MKTYKINLYCRKVIKNDKEYYFYSAIDKNGNFTDLRFTKEVKAPLCGGMLTVEEKSINLAKDYHGTGRDCFWVKEIMDFKPRDGVQNLSDFFEEV